jgi:hypothetical protein
MISSKSGRLGYDNASLDCGLSEGLINLVGDRWLYLHVINHPLVATMYRDVPGKPKTPSYLPARSFVTALLDLIVLRAHQLGGSPLSVQDTAPRQFDDVYAALLRCKQFGHPVADAIYPIVPAAGGSLERAQQELEAWYDQAMARVSGWYKRFTQVQLFVIGMLVAVCFNVDTLPNCQSRRPCDHRWRVRRDGLSKRAKSAAFPLECPVRPRT